MKFDRLNLHGYCCEINSFISFLFIVAVESVKSIKVLCLFISSIPKSSGLSVDRDPLLILNINGARVTDCPFVPYHFKLKRINTEITSFLSLY